MNIFSKLFQNLSIWKYAFFFIFFNFLAYSGLNPLRQNVCEVFVQSFFSQTQVKNSSVQYLQRFRENILGPCLDLTSQKLKQLPFLNQEIDINSADNRRSLKKVYQQMLAVEDFRQKDKKSHSITLKGKEIDVFLKKYFDNIGLAKSITPNSDEIIGLGAGILFLYVPFLIPMTLDSWSKLITLMILGHSGGHFYTLPKQFLFQRDHKIHTFLSRVKEKDFGQKEGHWHYLSFHYQTLKIPHQSLISGMPYQVEIDNLEYDRAPWILKKYYFPYKVNSRKELEEIWVGVDFLFFHDFQEQMETLTITIRSGDKRPLKSQKRTIKSKQNKTLDKIKSYGPRPKPI